MKSSLTVLTGIALFSCAGIFLYAADTLPKKDGEPASRVVLTEAVKRLNLSSEEIDRLTETLRKELPAQSGAGKSRAEASVTSSDSVQLTVVASKEAILGLLASEESPNSKKLGQEIFQSIQQALADEDETPPIEIAYLQVKRSGNELARVKREVERTLVRVKKEGDRAVNKAFPMEVYCVTYTRFTSEKDKETYTGNPDRETIHVRGGIDLAKIRAKMDHGHKNVVSVERGRCD